MPDNCWPPCSTQTSITGISNFLSVSTDQSERVSVWLMASTSIASNSLLMRSMSWLPRRRCNSMKRTKLTIIYYFSIGWTRASYLYELDPDFQLQWINTSGSPGILGTGCSTARPAADTHSMPNAMRIQCRIPLANSPPARQQRRQWHLFIGEAMERNQQRY